MVLGLLATALAAPRFLTEEPEVRRLAEAAWDAGVACAGRPAATAPEIAIVPVSGVRGGFAGRAHAIGGGLRMIVLTDDKPRTIAHEVAHAWVHRGSPARDDPGRAR